MRPVNPSASVAGVSKNPGPPEEGIPEADRPPTSTLGFEGRSVSSSGGILGAWEPRGWLNGEYYGVVRDRSDPMLPLSDGDLLVVPEGETLTLLYGGEVDKARDFLDALAFRAQDGELLYGAESGLLALWADLKKGEGPVVLPARQPTMVGEEGVGITTDLPPAVHVVPVSASVAEGDARYNFRVSVE